MEKEKPQKTIEGLEAEKLEQMEIIKNSDIVIADQTKVAEDLLEKKNKATSTEKENKKVNEGENYASYKEKMIKDMITEARELGYSEDEIKKLVGEENYTEKENIEKELSPEKIESLEEQLGKLEKEMKDNIENGPLSERIRSGVLNGLTKWETFGQGEEGWKGFQHRMTKTAVNMALIGAISMVSMDHLVKNVTTTVSSGFTSRMATRLGFGLTMGSAVDVGGKKISSERMQKLMPWITGVTSVAIATALSGAVAAGLAAGASAYLGYQASKFIKGKAINERIGKNKEEAKQKLLEKYGIVNNNEQIDISKIPEFEEEYKKLIKRFENKAIGGKLLNEGLRIIVGTGTSMASMEASSLAHSFSHHQPTVENSQHHNQEATKSEIRDDSKPNSFVKNITEIKTKPDTQNYVELKPENAPHNFVELKNHIDTKVVPEVKMEDIIVHKGQGIESVFIRQIEHNHDLAKELGYKGDMNDAKALHIFAGHEAHVIAIKEGYVDSNGNEVRVAEADKLGYEIKSDHGHISVNERTVEGKILETHHEGDKFEQNPDKGEYLKNHEVKAEHTVNTNEADKYKLPEQVNPVTGEHIVHAEGLNIVDNKLHQATPATEKTPVEIINKGLYHGPHTMMLNSKGDEIITTPPLAGLSTEDLNHIYVTFHENINHIFNTEKLMSAWNHIKKDVNAYELMRLSEKGEIDHGFDPFINHIKQLEEMTGFKPITESALHPAESITHFINRAMEKVQLEGKLDKIKV